MTPTLTQPLVEGGRFLVRQEPSPVRQEPSPVRQEPSPVRHDTVLSGWLRWLRQGGAGRLAARAERAARAHDVARLRSGLEHQRVVSAALLGHPGHR